jgi:radical SAM protein (TIGR01212 family)
MTPRYNSLSLAFRALYGRRAKKIPLDAGSACPNRDGALSRGGCLYCNAMGSGTGLYHKGFGLRAQWDALTPAARGRGEALVAYLQSFSNTYGPLGRLTGLLGELAGLPDIAGLCLGTRPDCLDAAKLDALAACDLGHVRLELGLQSANDATLTRINRGHDAACFAAAVRATAERGLWVTAHVMAGLPGETPADFLATVDFVNALPVSGIKLHNGLVVEGAPLAALFRAGAYAPLARQEYIDVVCAAIARLRPDMVIERLNADPAPGELVAPDWAMDKRGLLRDIAQRLERDDIRQGDAWPGPD